MYLCYSQVILGLLGSYHEHGGCMFEYLLILPVILCRHAFLRKFWKCMYCGYLKASLHGSLFLWNNEMSLNVSGSSWSVSWVKFTEIRNVRVTLVLSELIFMLYIFFLGERSFLPWNVWVLCWLVFVAGVSGVSHYSFCRHADMEVLLILMLMSE